MLYREIIAAFSEIRTEHINTLHDFRLLSWSRWELRSSGLLCSEYC